MTDEIPDDDIDEAPVRRLRFRVSTAIGLCLVLITGSAITWNALFNQRPKVTGVAARTIELKATRTVAAQPAPKPKAAAAGAKAEIAVDATATPAKASPGAAGSQTVAALQAQLANLGLYDGAANGTLDAATQAAIDRYRQQNDLGADVSLDGVLDHARFAAQIVQAANYAPPADDPQPATVSEGETAASAGARDEILFVQKGLAELGYAPGPVDGHLGDITRRAIRDFQAERHLPINGEITPELIAELRKTSGLTTFLTRP